MVISACCLTVILLFSVSFLSGCSGHDKSCAVNNSEYAYVSTEQLDTSQKNIKTIQQLVKSDGIFPKDLYYYLVLGTFTRSAQVEVLPGFVQTLKQNTIYQLPTYASAIHSISYFRCGPEIAGIQEKSKAEGMSIDYKNVDPGSLYVVYIQEKEGKAVPRVRKIDYLELSKVRNPMSPSSISLPDGRTVIGAEPDISKFGVYLRLKTNQSCAGRTQSALPMWYDIITNTRFLPYIEICQTDAAANPNKAISHVPWTWFRDKYLHPPK